MRRIRLLIAIGLALALIAPTVGWAQSRADQSPAERQALWYEETMMGLARSLGAAHAIRLNCANGDYTLFGMMEELIAQEGSERRLALESAWNEGFRLHYAMYPVCTAQAIAAEATLREQGGRFADGLAATTIDPPPP